MWVFYSLCRVEGDCNVACARACVELLVGTLFVAKGGALIIGTAAAPVTALARVLWRDDKAINSTVDPEQYQVSYFVVCFCLCGCAVFSRADSQKTKISLASFHWVKLRFTDVLLRVRFFEPRRV